jgi:phosphonate transport system substrate-binding protein
MLLKKMIWLGLLCISVPAFFGCNNNGTSKKISLEKREILQKRTERLRKAPLRFAVGGMITPKDGFVYYREFIDYIGEKLNRPVEFIDREKYDEINSLMKSGRIDVAFVCSGPYVDGHDEFGMELLAAPQAYKKTVYYAYIIVRKDSPINSFNALRGKTFAFADPLSNTGRIVPEYLLAKMNETPKKFFKKYIYTYAHDKSIKAVAQGVADGASVDSLIWEYTDRINPGLTAKTKIIEKSPPYTVPPVVVRKGLSPGLKKELRAVFLNAHRDKRGKELLGNMMIDKFVVIDDSAYDSVREMKSWISRHKEREETR